jgi:hypothetical protein
MLAAMPTAFTLLFVHIQRATRRHVPEYKNLQNHGCKNLQSDVVDICPNGFESSPGSVNTETTLRDRWLRYWGWIPGRGRDFSFSPQCPHRIWDPPSLLCYVNRCITEDKVTWTWNWQLTSNLILRWKPIFFIHKAISVTGREDP